MNKLLSRLADLVNVKTMVTFAVTIVFCTLALRGTIPPDAVMNIVAVVIAFYFGTQLKDSKSIDYKDEKNNDS